jgi:hypothetical protein
LRVATRGGQDDVVLVHYKDGTTASRVLDGDTITFYGISDGLYTYKSTMAGLVTIPRISVLKIDQIIGEIAVDSKNDFDAEGIAKALEVIQRKYRYSYFTGVILIVKNTSDFTLEISAELETFAANGRILAHKSSTVNAVGAGQMTILDFSLDEDFAVSKYKLSVVPEKYYKSVTQDLTYTYSSAKNKEIITVTNNGNIPAEFVRGNVIFLKNEIIVYMDQESFTDNDFELKPGKSITKEAYCSEEYDSFIIIFAGRG